MDKKDKLIDKILQSFVHHEETSDEKKEKSIQELETLLEK